MSTAVDVCGWFSASTQVGGWISASRAITVSSTGAGRWRETQKLWSTAAAVISWHVFSGVYNRVPPDRSRHWKRDFSSPKQRSITDRVFVWAYYMPAPTVLLHCWVVLVAMVQVDTPSLLQVEQQQGNSFNVADKKWNEDKIIVMCFCCKLIFAVYFNSNNFICYLSSILIYTVYKMHQIFKTKYVVDLIL